MQLGVSLMMDEVKNEKSMSKDLEACSIIDHKDSLIAEFVALMREEGKKINPATATIHEYWTDVQDVYQICKPCGCNGKVLFASNPYGPAVADCDIPDPIWDRLVKRIKDDEKKDIEEKFLAEEQFKNSRLGKIIEELRKYDN